MPVGKSKRPSIGGQKNPKKPAPKPVARIGRSAGTKKKISGGRGA